MLRYARAWAAIDTVRLDRDINPVMDLAKSDPVARAREDLSCKSNKI